MISEIIFLVDRRILRFIYIIQCLKTLFKRYEELKYM